MNRIAAGLTETIPPSSARRSPWSLNLQTGVVGAMTIGTLLIAGLYLFVTLRQPFEQTDDLIWLSKLRNDSFLDLTLSPAWMVQSPFYRPVAEFFLKCLFSVIGFNPVPYRFVQFAVFLVMMGFSLVVVRRLGLRWETVLLLTVFALGSPFISWSVAWLSELPHVIVLVCFAAALAVLLSDRPVSTKLYLSALAFAIALLSKENGLILILLYLYFLRSAPFKAALVFGGITVAYFLLRAIVLGPSMGTAGVEESVGYFFQYLSNEERRTLFSGYAVYKLYAYNVLAQLAALAFRITQWGKILDGIPYQTLLESASTALIIGGAIAFKKRGEKVSSVVIIVAATAILGTFLSYSYARDRHLALPAFAYSFLLAMAVTELGGLLRSRAQATVLLACVWLAWSLQACLTIREIHRASVDTIERVYRPNPTPTNPNLPLDAWTAAREHALAMARRP